MSQSARDAAPLENEANVLTQYLLGRDCPPECVARYVAGHAALEAGRGETGRGLVAFAVAHPWALPLLDAGAAFIRDGALLRAKLHLVSAVLEATPTFADEFLPRTVSRMSLAVQLPWLGASAAFKAALGIPLTLVVARWTR